MISSATEIFSVNSKSSSTAGIGTIISMTSITEAPATQIGAVAPMRASRPPFDPTCAEAIRQSSFV